MNLTKPTLIQYAESVEKSTVDAGVTYINIVLRNL